MYFAQAIQDCLKFLNSLAVRNKQYKRISRHCFIIPQLQNLASFISFTAQIIETKI